MENLVSHYLMQSVANMGHSFVLITILAFAISVSHAALPEQVVYWNKVLPNTPMPSAVKDLLQTDEFVDEKSGAVINVGKGGVFVNTGKPKPGGTSVNVGNGHVGVNTGKGTNVNVGHGGVGVHTGKGTNVNVGHGGVGVHTGKGTSVNVGHGGVGVYTGKGKPGGTRVNVGKGGVIVNTPPKKKPVIVNAAPFIYKYAATESQIHNDPQTTLFFLEKDLQSGTKMTLHFTPTTSDATFVSQREANSIPFTSSKLPEILSRFSVEPDSIEGETMKKTLSECEEPPMAGESKYCATSLESMVEFSTTTLGTRYVVSVSTTINEKNSPKQQYKIVSSGVKKLSGSNLVVCHAQTYAYAVFYCHNTQVTKAYQVSMLGKDGAKVEAVAICHTDTSAWNPKHVAFKVLGVKPGTVPICHFLPQDHLVWGRKI